MKQSQDIMNEVVPEKSGTMASTCNDVSLESLVRNQWGKSRLASPLFIHKGMLCSLLALLSSFLITYLFLERVSLEICLPEQ